MSLCRIGNLELGAGKPLAIIGGPCVLESEALGQQVGRVLRDACAAAGLQYIFKASFDKANRSSINSPRGPGMERGLTWLADLRRELAVPVTTDLHEPAQAEAVANHVDLLQIPAFLCRQTDLVLAVGQAAARLDRAVNIKKGQFLSPGEMVGPVRKLTEVGCMNAMLTERGTFFGYGRLVNDFIGIVDMMHLSHKGRGPTPVCFDCTHSTQLPGSGEQTGGRPDRAAHLARAAVAAGVHCVFLECHPDPKSALSDGSTMLRLEEVPALIKQLAAIRKATASF